jgi:hypothetical protein
LLHFARFMRYFYRLKDGAERLKFVSALSDFRVRREIFR